VRGGGPDGPVAVISYGFWQRHFAGARSVIGAPITVDRVSFTVVGVLPRAFHGLDVGRDFEIAVPIQVGTARDGAALPLVHIIGRLHPEGTMSTATAALRAVQPQIRAATLPQGWPDVFLERYLRSPFSAVPATHTSLLRRQFVRPLLAIMVVVSLVVLVACANLANLGGARAAARRRELGLRRALGASRLRLIRQLTAESVILAAASAAFGLLIATWSAELLVQQLATRVGSSGPDASTGGVFVDVAIDARVLAFTLAVTVCTIVIVGILPALGASRVAPMDALLEGRGEGRRRRRAVLGHAFLALQVAISVIVAIAAGLFARTLISLETRPLGFATNGILVTTMEAGAVPPAGRQTVYEDLLERVRREPGVTLAALSSVPPVTNGPTIGQPIQAVSGEAPLPPRGANTDLNLISPGWFDTLGIRLLQGRDVNTGDRAGALPVVVVNETFVRTFIHGGSPIGRTVSLFLPGTPPPPVEIIGVVGDTVYGGLRDKIEPTMYLPIAQLGPIWLRFLTPMTLSVRTPVSPVEQLSKPVARAVTSANGDLSLTFHALQDYVNDSLVQERLIARLSVAFALLAVLLAALGLYGVAAFAVAGRRSEIGIRIALGASPSAVVRLVLGLMFRPVTIGLLSGVVVSLWLSRLVDSLVYDVTTRDPATFVMAAGVLSAVALVASWLPARRAARIEPASIVRCT
jgi:predicted permease